MEPIWLKQAREVIENCPELPPTPEGWRDSEAERARAYFGEDESRFSLRILLGEPAVCAARMEALINSSVIMHGHTLRAYIDRLYGQLSQSHWSTSGSEPIPLSSESPQGMLNGRVYERSVAYGTFPGGPGGAPLFDDMTSVRNFQHGEQLIYSKGEVRTNLDPKHVTGLDYGMQLYTGSNEDFQSYVSVTAKLPDGYMVLVTYLCDRHGEPLDQQPPEHGTVYYRHGQVCVPNADLVKYTETMFTEMQLGARE